ncbi:MAG: hypothetical protein ACRC68_00460 [Clostridium sp.]
MSNKSIVIDNQEVTGDIIKRLENNRDSIYLLDTTDNSKIVMSDEVLNLIQAFYKCRNKWGASING